MYIVSVYVCTKARLVYYHYRNNGTITYFVSQHSRKAASVRPNTKYMVYNSCIAAN
jgi:hypothetical protein